MTDKMNMKERAARVADSWAKGADTVFTERMAKNIADHIRALPDDDWRPIETHDGSTQPCMIAILDSHGHLEIAEKAEWEPGDVHEEWDEVEDGVKIKLWEDQDEGRWLTNWGAIEEPTHFQPLTTLRSKANG